MTIRTVDGLDAILDEAHWETHIVSRHPELKGWLTQVTETLQQPIGVYRSKRDRTTRIYAKLYERVALPDAAPERLALLVYVRESNGFVVTAYLAGAMMRSLGEQIWPS